MKSNTMHRVSIKDIAREARVSVATVSRILNTSSYPVSDQLRERVTATIQKLHYKPCLSAQNLRAKTTNTIGLLVRDIADPYFASIAKGVTERALVLSFMPLVCSTNRDPALELRYIYLLSHYQVAGIVLAGAGWLDMDFTAAMEGALTELDKQKTRIVACAPQKIHVPSITVDDVAVGKAAHETLFALGHRSFAVLAGQHNNLSSHLRSQGFLQTHHERGLSTQRCVMIHQEDYNWQQGYHAGCAIATFPTPPTAVFCVADSIAIGALRGLSEGGKNVPDDISVLSVGDTKAAAYSTPPLSSFQLSLENIGAEAVNLIANAAVTDIYSKFMTFSLVQRKSLAPPPNLLPFC